MILVGQYDSPYVRRVAISLRVLGFNYEQDTRSVFGDFDSMRTTNPLGRIPSLILDGGETLIDSAAILDWLDEEVGPERALLPRGGAGRREAFRRIALATGAIDKFGAANYERLTRPSQYRWPEWIARCLTQGNAALAALEALATGSGADHHLLHDQLPEGDRAGLLLLARLPETRCVMATAGAVAGLPRHRF